jgi:hypothetical protein
MALFKVQTRDKTDRNQLLLELLRPRTAEEFNQKNNSATGMILYATRIDNLNDEVPVDNLIIHPKMIEHLETHGILTRPAPTASHPDPFPCLATSNTSSDPQTPVHLPAGSKVRNESTLIGLFDGGSKVRCGILHATGFCIMRRAVTRDSKNNAIASPFCHVCRYVLADRLDPSAYFDIDQDFKMPEFGP